MKTFTYSMGNSLRHELKNGRFLNHYQEIYVGTGARIGIDMDSETWSVSYSARWSEVQFSLTILYDKNGYINLLKFSFGVPMFITFVIHRSNTLYSFNQVLLDPIEIKDSGKSYGTRFVNETKNHWGGVTKTNVIYFGDEYDGNLIVVEQKRKRGVEKSGAVRVAHYYAIFNSKRSRVSFM